ncbi:MAG: serine acetyltransferase [Bacteroidetes bacterium]|nr:serine acetyltransferase [Bacteroidota bacterium]
MESLEEFARFIYKIKRDSLAVIPERSHAERIIDKLMTLLFGQGCSKNEFMITGCLDTVKQELCPMIKVCCKTDDAGAETLADSFFHSLISVYNLLLHDASFIEASDPATNSIDEVIITYPGFYAIAVHRFAHELYKLNIPYLPRLMSEYAHSRTGIDIHPGAAISSPFAIDHGTGVVIGETCIIGKEVKVYQGVTLGALAVEKAHASKKRHPSIGDAVVLYAGCTILGGNTEIGHHSIIGGNVWLTASVAPYSVVMNTARNRIQNSPILDEAMDWVI